jgi:hypothetical protein
LNEFFFFILDWLLIMPDMYDYECN